MDENEASSRLFCINLPLQVTPRELQARSVQSRQTSSHRL